MADSESDRSMCYNLLFRYSNFEPQHFLALAGKINLVDLAGSENNKVCILS